MAAYGFLKAKDWAWTTAVIAHVVSLLTGFFGMIPDASRGLFPVFIIVFVPNLITTFLLLSYVAGWTARSSRSVSSPVTRTCWPS